MQKFTKTRILSIILVLLLATAPGIYGQNLKLASDIWPPFTNEAGDVHYASDLVNEAFGHMNMKANTTIIEFSEVITGINDGRFDGSAALWKSSKRESYMVFSDPYLENRLVVVGRKGSPVNYRRLSDLRGKKLALVENYAYGDELDTLKSVKVIYGKSEQQCLNMLLSGKADYILLDQLLAHQLETYQMAEVSKYLVIGDWPVIINSLHFALRKDVPEAVQIINQFNKVIDKMLKDGSYNEILNLPYVLSDVDNDGKIEVVLTAKHSDAAPPTDIYSIMSTPGRLEKQDGQEFYMNGKPYESWQAIPNQSPTQAGNYSNNINILNFKLSKK